MSVTLSKGTKLAIQQLCACHHPWQRLYNWYWSLQIVPHFKVKDFHLGGFAEWKADMIVFSYLVDEQSIGEILHSLWREPPLDGQIWIVLFDRTGIPIIQIEFLNVVLGCGLLYGFVRFR